MSSSFGGDSVASGYAESMYMEIDGICVASFAYILSNSKLWVNLMSILFESTKKFENELATFPDKEKKRIVLKLNQYTRFLESDTKEFYKHAYQPLRLHLSDEDESSLYALRVNHDIRIIMTIDEDPIFDQTLITLLRVVRHSSLDKVFKGVAESLYQRTLHSSFAEKA